MKAIATLTILYLLSASHMLAQRIGADGRPTQEVKQTQSVEKKIKTWRLADDYTLSDTIKPDTLLTGYQRYNPVMYNNPMVVSTGNLGAPSRSIVLSELSNNSDFIFSDALQLYFQRPHQFLFYNTTLPYTNLTYRTGGPKRRSEENIKVLFTQNVNKRLNLGVSYNLMSSIGRYDAQRADNEMVRFFTSYDGAIYSAWGNISLNKSDHYENGGLESDDPILFPKQFGYNQSENIPVVFTDAKNKIKNKQFFVAQSLALGSISVGDTIKGIKQLPVGTIYHSAEFDTYKRTYTIDNLPQYYAGNFANAYYPNVYTDTLKTRDTTSYSVLRNIVQIKFNEEANTLLKFGLRAFLVNEIRSYNTQQQPLHYTVTNKVWYPHYRQTKQSQTTTAIGGQIFKNLGQNFWWNGGLKVYVQGYRAGDSEITGQMNSLFKVLNDTAGVFASGGIYLQSPGLLLNQYYSNHFQWNHQFNREKTLKLRGGVRIPTKRFELAGEVRLINDHFYWNHLAMPDQSSKLIQLVEVSLKQHFKLAGINSENRVYWQATSDAEVAPLPALALYSANYYENIAFKVLKFQVGFDVRFHTAYYTPGYMPATMQFYNQRNRITGEYPFVDAFVNFHLKRARIGIKMEHVNKGYPNNDYFITDGYAANPRSVKVAVSWNFYD